VTDFDRSFEMNPALLQAEVGQALSDGIAHDKSKGLAILHTAESKIQERGVGDSEAIYKLAQAYAVLGDTTSALRLLKHSIDNGFFPYPYFVSDPLLDNVRAESEFTELLRSARQRHEAFRKAYF
jgi:eukaryotic-like serine/threonine-protein kinase